MIVPEPVVHVVDGDEAARRSLASLLGSAGYRSAAWASAEALLDALDSLQQGCVVADLNMPGMDALALQDEMSRHGARLPMVIVTGTAEVATAVRAMKGGAVDFIQKPYSGEVILAAVAASLARLEDMRQHDDAAATATARVATLTPREHDVLHHLLDGQPNKVIAHELGISPRTVEIHRANVMEKLGCRSLAEAVRLAVAAGVSSN
jgi:two-component system, LuxR family, response regulator FixJ